MHRKGGREGGGGGGWQAWLGRRGRDGEPAQAARQKPRLPTSSVDNVDLPSSCQATTSRVATLLFDDWRRTPSSAVRAALPSLGTTRCHAPLDGCVTPDMLCDTAVGVAAACGWGNCREAPQPGSGAGGASAACCPWLCGQLFACRLGRRLSRYLLQLRRAQRAASRCRRRAGRHPTLGCCWESLER